MKTYQNRFKQSNVLETHQGERQPTFSIQLKIRPPSRRSLQELSSDYVNDILKIYDILQIHDILQIYDILQYYDILHIYDILQIYYILQI